MNGLLLPTTREEAWRWSDLAALPALADTSPSGSRRSADDLWIEIGGPRLVFVDGVYDAGRSHAGPVRIGAANANAARHPLGRLAGAEGWSVTIDRDITDPIQIVHLGTGGANHVAAEIRVDTGASATIVETFAGDGWVNRATHITLAASARGTIARRCLHETGFQSQADTVEIGTDAHFVATTLVAGHADSRLDGHLTVVEAGGFAAAGGALLGRARQRHDAAYVVCHAAPSGRSRQIWRAVADEQATCSSAARVDVARHAQKTDAEQSLRGLLMARTATVNLKPELEIFADDVKCGHGATVGELDQQGLFYCASRGIPPQQARAILTRAFVADAIRQIEDETIREAFASDAFSWLSA